MIASQSDKKVNGEMNKMTKDCQKQQLIHKDENLTSSCNKDTLEKPCKDATIHSKTCPIHHHQSLVHRSSSMVSENLPNTPSGWVTLVSFLASCLLGYELRLQKSLTCPPRVYAQVSSSSSSSSSSLMTEIYHQMTASPDSLLCRNIQPSLFVGTRAYVASTAAYLLRGPGTCNKFHRFREIMTMSMDGAIVALDWELPEGNSITENQVRNGPIQIPIVLVIHGINNHANFGYIRSMMRACTKRGWIAAGLNMRGCGGLPLTTPRGYNAAYTGDVRCVVQQLAGRLTESTPLFLVGNSLSAGLVTKYLGEEGLCGTLPDCIAGGAALGNPVSINSSKMSVLFSPLLALGVKKSILEQWAALQQIKEPHFLKCIRRALMAVTLAEFDSAMAPVMIRNDPVYPFSFRIGFKDGPSYWNDASSYRLIRFVSVPMLQLLASDDFLVYKAFQERLAYCLANPNVMVVESKCGGHLGWHEAPPSNYGLGTSWADSATTEFIDVVFQMYYNKRKSKHHGISPERNRNLVSNTFPRSKL